MFFIYIEVDCKFCLLVKKTFGFLSLPNEVGDLLILVRFFVYFFFFSFFFFPPKLYSDEYSVAAGRIVLKFEDLVDMEVKLCNRVSNFKISDSKAGPQTCPKPPKFCPDYSSLTTEGIVLIFFRYDRLLQESLKFEIQDSVADPEACPGPNNS